MTDIYGQQHRRGESMYRNRPGARRPEQEPGRLPPEAESSTVGLWLWTGLVIATMLVAVAVAGFLLYRGP